ncbi:MAG: type VI secretion system protein ImpH [Planctomycetota bacterium]|jgi:type VI secretion system protein ImpH
MAAPRRKPSTPLIEHLASSPERFEFHQAVRLLELMGLSSGEGNPVGAHSPPAAESVDFRVHPSLAYATSAIRACKVDTEEGAALARLDVTFTGLIGSAGVLPPHYSELILARQLHRDTALRDFLDILHRRTLALIHRGWRKTAFPFAFELEAQQQLDHDQFTVGLLSLVGLGTKSLRRRQAVNDLAFAFAGGAYANQVKSAVALAGILSATFAVPFDVEQLVGSWMEIPVNEQSTLLRYGEAPAERHTLGGGISIGTRVWDVQSRLRLVAGPMTLSQFQFFADESPGRIRVMAMARSFVGDAIQVDLECILAEDECPGIQLGDGQRIGRDAWLEHAPRPDEQRSARFPLVLV